MSTTTAAPAYTAEQMAALEAQMMILRGQLAAREAEVVVLRAQLGIEGDDGLMSLRRLHLLEDASDACRTHFLGGAVTRDQALAACEAARRAS